MKMHLRVGQFNLPGSDKLPNEANRLMAAAKQITAANLDVLSTNELVGTGKDGSTVPSKTAALLLGYLGPDWRMLVPTTAFNENYILYRPGKVSLLKQHPDLKVYAKVDGRSIPGRHLSRAMFTDLDTGRTFFFGSTHLVNNDEVGAAAQAPLVMAGAQAIAGTRPIIIAGDMNTDRVLTGFTRAGLQNARIHAKAVTHGDAATYVKYSATKPTKDPDWIIDQLYVPDVWTVDGYTVVLDTTTAGTFRPPRPSDHLLVITAVTEN
jgi:endonuclease/exonuclease/phosphatase family metal-dependent hydrolase